jgi:acetyltransferase-like isoleucine patch superfamily enzyme
MIHQLTRFFIFLFFNKYEKRVAFLLKYKRILILNFIVQRIFGNSAILKYSLHYTSKINTDKNGLIIENDSPSVLISLAISGGCYISIHDGTTLKIGEHSLLASHVSIVTGNHGLINRDEYVAKDVEIGKNCWLAKGVCIMPGVILGNNVTVGANSVVTKSFPDNVVIAGIPAKIIKYLDVPKQ